MSDVDKTMVVYASTQLMHSVIARCLGVPEHSIRVITRRAGGGFGGKKYANSTINRRKNLESLCSSREGKVVESLCGSYSYVGLNIRTMDASCEVPFNAIGSWVEIYHFKLFYF
ncbi:hypothetical protein KY289_008965 [Solanum tuberosum]|nr:hypothetical protein KY289_008965 [Solanum tuberosum]